MQPNRSRTPWGWVASVATYVAVATGILIGIGLLALLPTGSFSADDSLDEHMCVTISRNALYDDESAFGKADANHVRSAETGRAYCKAYDDFEHPYAARMLSQYGGTPMLIAVFGIALTLRRIIERTWDSGPFHVDAIRLFDRFRWWAAGAVAAATAIQWVCKGIRVQLLTDEPWPDLSIPWLVVIVWIALTLTTTHLETVARRDDNGRV
jgi:hypothetical protein